MITIYEKATRLRLELDPDNTFEITHEHPMLDTTHTPVPFSTSISFPLSERNKLVFGFLGGAMMLEPSVKSLEVDIHIGGFRMLSGVLLYEGFEDGLLKYSFSGRNLEEDWNAKIWTQVNPLTSTIPAAYTTTRKLEFIRAIKEGTHFLAAPLLINKDATEYTVYEACNWAEKVEHSIKFHNWPGQDNVIFTPTFRVQLLLEKILKNTILDDAILPAYRQLAIIAQYKPDGNYNEIGIPLLAGYDCQNMLPDITVYNLIQNLARIFCAAIYKDGDSLRLIAAKTILEDPDFVDWSGKISDVASFSREASTSYVLKFSNSDEENVYDLKNLSEDLDDGDIITAESFLKVIKGLGRNSAADEDTEEVLEGFKAVRHGVSQDIYSGRYTLLARPYNAHFPVCDLIYHHNPVVDTSVSESGESFDNSIDFNLVRCLPECAIRQEGGYSYRMCPVIEPATIGSARGNDVYIGILTNNQLVDKGLSFAANASAFNNTPDEDCGLSLAPDALYEAYHREFAEWLATDRQVISVDLNLSPLDIVNFRPYRKVLLKNRLWLVKKLSLTMSASSELIKASGEFISL